MLRLCIPVPYIYLIEQAICHVSNFEKRYILHDVHEIFDEQKVFLSCSFERKQRWQEKKAIRSFCV